MNIWKICPKTKDLEKIEKEARDFLKKHHPRGEGVLPPLEEAIYSCPPGGEEALFSPLLGELNNRSLKLLLEFNELFRCRLFPHIPQKILGGLSPVRYALLLKSGAGS